MSFIWQMLEFGLDWIGLSSLQVYWIKSGFDVRRVFCQQEGLIHEYPCNGD
jgi:hypothetical protein